MDVIIVTILPLSFLPPPPLPCVSCDDDIDGVLVVIVDNVVVGHKISTFAHVMLANWLLLSLAFSCERDHHRNPILLDQERRKMTESMVGDLETNVGYDFAPVPMRPDDVASDHVVEKWVHSSPLLGVKRVTTMVEENYSIRTVEEAFVVVLVLPLMDLPDPLFDSGSSMFE